VPEGSFAVPLANTLPQPVGTRHHRSMRRVQA
jgi:hypothetical protein